MGFKQNNYVPGVAASSFLHVCFWNPGEEHL